MSIYSSKIIFYQTRISFSGIFFVAIIDDITQKIVGCFISANRRRPSCRNLLSESNENEEVLSDSSACCSNEDIELRAVRFQVDEPDENAPTRKATKLIIGLSIHSCKFVDFIWMSQIGSSNSVSFLTWPWESRVCLSDCTFFTFLQCLIVIILRFIKKQ